MLISAPRDSAQILRIALGAPAVYGVALMMEIPVPFVAAMLFATVAIKMPVAPPIRVVGLLGVLLTLVPWVFSLLSGVLGAYPYLMVCFVGLVLFHAFRLQAVPKTALAGVLLQTFGLLMPLISTAYGDIGGALTDGVALIFAKNAVLALAGIYVAFAVFPGEPGRSLPVPAEARGEASARTRAAAMAALVMLPLVMVFLALEVVSAIRVLFTVATVLVALERRDAAETGAEILMSILLAGAAAVAFSVLAMIWQSTGAMMLVMALVGLVVVPGAFAGRWRAEVALAVPLVWLLIGVSGDAPIQQSLTWSVYSLIGVGYAIGASALLAPRRIQAV